MDGGVPDLMRIVTVDSCFRGNDEWSVEKP